MDSLQDILSQKDFTPPDEVALIKDYIKRRYDAPSWVRMEQNAVVVSVPGHTLAASIHLERQALIDQCRIKKRLVIRSGR